MILAGDIGGTHTRLALLEKGAVRWKIEKKYLSRSYKDLGTLVQEFLREQQVSVSKACFGIAGPIQQGRCQATNLPWTIDAKELSTRLQIEKVHLLNDLEANAYGLKELKPEEFYVLQKGIAQPGNQALISAGTGLGEAGLFWDGEAHCPFACEGGHVDFAPRDRLEMELLEWLQRKFEHVSYERVISGPGLRALYEFLVETKKEEKNREVEAEMGRKDPSFVISEYGKFGKDRACTRAVEWFVSLYGAEAGNVALKFLSLNGLYVGGGIAPNLIEVMKQGKFTEAFCNKGRFQALLQALPIYVVLNDNAALLGAASFAQGL
jgi:glucokinase